MQTVREQELELEIVYLKKLWRVRIHIDVNNIKFCFLVTTMPVNLSWKFAIVLIETHPMRVIILG